MTENQNSKLIPVSKKFVKDMVEAKNPIGILLSSAIPGGDIENMVAIPISHGLDKAPTVTDCVCAESGRPVLEDGKKVFHCETHKCTKTLRMYDQCRTNGDSKKQWDDNKGPRQNKPPQPKYKSKEKRPRRVPPTVFRLGDNIEMALTAVGITSERVTNWLGRDCGCTERKKALNKLGAWAFKVLGGGLEEGEKELDIIIEESKAKKKGKGDDKHTAK